MLRVLRDGDAAGGYDAFSRAFTLGARHNDTELRTLAAIGRGRCLLYLGDVAGGLALLDEAMVAVEARELAPLAVGDAYCTVIDACHELFDLRRCEIWGAAFQRWCDAQPELVLYRGHCLLHRAELLTLHGRWEEALSCVHDACARLSKPLDAATLGGARYVEAELHRLRGDHLRAEQAFEQAHVAGSDPQPGLSLLRLAQGRADLAEPALRRAVAEAEGPVARSRHLAAYAEALLARDQPLEAQAVVTELAAVADVLRSPLLRAYAWRLQGAVLLATDDVPAALPLLRRALTTWVELDAPYEQARSRLHLADACSRLGDDEGAGLERRSARAALEQLGAPLDACGPAPVPPGGLTSREADVLRLVAQGCTNREVAGRLFISEKTVVTHLSHVFTKLGVTSRSGATAFALRHGLG
jgi:DNA-binding CsgD family transcriptional regulator/tetratricopeptide (TPR) repeat protein